MQKKKFLKKLRIEKAGAQNQLNDNVMPSQRENSKERRFSRLIKPPSVLKEPSFYNLSGIEEQKSIFDKVETPLRKITESEASPC